MGVRGVEWKGVGKEVVIIFAIFLFSDILHYDKTIGVVEPRLIGRVARYGGRGVLPVSAGWYFLTDKCTHIQDI